MKPSFRVTVNGSDITNLIGDRLVSLTLTDEAGVKSDRVELVLDDRDQKLAIPPKKAVLTVAIGYSDRLVNKGKFTVEELELNGPVRQMIIRANATEFSKGAGAAKSKSWHETTLGAIAQEIGTKRKWTVKVSPELANVPYSHVDQTESDIQFLTRLATENGAVAKVSHGTLVIAPHAKAKTTSGKSMPSITIRASEVADWSYTESSRSEYDGVSAEYYNIETGERGIVTEGEDTDNTHVLPQAYGSEKEAKAAAKSKRNSLKRGNRSFTIGNMLGKPELEAECKLNAIGFRKGVDGNQWIVNSVTHRLTNSTYTCSIQCETELKTT